MPDSRFLHPSSPSPSPKPTPSTATSTTSNSTPPQAKTPLTSDHPLSPSLSRRTLSKRASSFHIHKPTTGDTAEGYFDLETARTRRHAATISSGVAGTDDLLGMATGTHASSRIDLFDNVLGARRRSETLSRIDSLSKEEAAVVEMRFDLMSEGEVEMYLRTMCPPRSRSGSNSTTSTSSSSSSSPRAISSLSTPRLITPTEVISPTTPRAQFAKRPFVPTPSSSDKTPLFPPSPRSKKARRPDHPLRILSRAVRELRESVEHLEEENARLKHELELALGKRPSRDVEADTASIHDDLTEALSTSLTSSPLRYAKSTQSYPASTYAPSIASRPKSPSSISIPYPSSPKIPPPSTREPPAGASDTGRRSANRASWTSGLWVWNKTKPRPRKGSAGSTSSQVSSLFPGATTRPVPEGAIAEDEDDEHAWRKGDGGSPPSFRAIFLATRIITPDPSSILTSSNTPNSLIAYLAHALVSSARDEGITAKDPPGRRTSRSRAVSVASQEAPPLVGDTARDGKGYGDQALAVGRSLFSSVSNATLRGKSALATSTTEDKPRPSLLSRASSSRAFPTTAISPPVERGNVSASTPEEPELPSVEMDAVVADENRPPTVLLSRQNIGSFFQSTKTGTTKLSTASRFKSDQPPLTDRYGFIYDIQHASMLKDASAAGTVAPASLNGIHPVAEVEEGWIEKQRRKSIQSSRSPSSDSLDRVASRTRASIDSSRSDRATERPQTPESRAGSTTPGSKTPEVTTPSAPASRSSSLVDTVGRHRSPSNLMNNLNPSSARAITAKDHLTVSARGASSLVSLVTSPTLPHSATMETTEVASTAPSAAASRATLSSLLDKLTENHDRQQKERKVLWDAFLRKRSRHRSNTLDGRGGGGEGGEGNGAIGIIGVNEMGIRGKKGEDDYKAFLRLVRGGIPLAYRSDIWAECSGAKDLFVPGEYAEILKTHANEQSPVEADIEKDVSRTFPGNVFFGGDGPGVAKLRRVLVAYSWHNPSVGYCQGMNMLAATLLLTHTDEEQAYWTLQAIVERLLPESFYSPDLLASRADQMVLADLVGQLVPRVHGHLEELGVDLASVTFGWFLSLFTDCLPVETLFRVWDVFFVEGRDTLFRVAVAILKLNEGDILDTTSVSDLFALMSGMTSRLWTADKLIQVQHSYKPIIRGGDVEAKFQKHLANLRAE